MFGIFSFWTHALFNFFLGSHLKEFYGIPVLMVQRLVEAIALLDILDVKMYMY